MILIHRNAAAQATIDRFLNQTFAWGTEDCAHLVAFNIAALGHPDPLAKIDTYATRRNALKAMRKAGIVDMATHLGTTLGFAPIAPAAALPGDIVGFTASAEDTAKGWLTLGVAIGQDRLLAFSPDGVCHPAQMSQFTGGHLTHAWRVPPVAGGI
jgi:hypothetical protein